MSKTAVLIGASGLVGNELLSLLLRDPYFSTVKILVRKSLGVQHPKLQEYTVRFPDDANIEAAIAGCHAVFCSVGTTRAKVKGDKTAYRKVDYDIPIAAATLADKHKANHFILVSAVGAAARSGNFYLQLKGEVEDLVSQKPAIQAIHFFQPSLLLGKRSERRLGEKAAQLLMPLFSFLMWGSLTKYRPITATDVAKAMLAVTKITKKGVYWYTYSTIRQLAAAS